MNNIKGKILTVLLFLSLGLVASCHSDSGGGPVAADETFRAGLVDLDIRRVSTGDTVAVDTSGITSEEMTLN